MSFATKSRTWLHFSEINDQRKVKCNYCDQVLSVCNKSTYNLVRHLKSKHPKTPIKKREFVARTTKNKIPIKQEHSEVGKAQHPFETPTSTSSSTSETLSINSARSVPPRSHRFSTNHINQPMPISKQKDIDRQLVKMITKEYYPLSIVDNSAFREFIQLLNPNYKLPTKKTVSSELIPELFAETLEKVQIRLRRASTVCLMVESWTSRYQDCFFSITAHYVVEEETKAYLDSDLLVCHPYAQNDSGKDIAILLQTILADWDISDKVAVIVTDNAVNMEDAMQKGNWNHWVCFAQSLNLSVQCALNDIQEVINKIRSIVRYFDRNSLASSQLRTEQENLGIPAEELELDDPTRWNSTYDMLSRVLGIQMALLPTFDVFKSSLPVPRTEEQPNMLTQNEWLVAEQSQKVLEIFDMVKSAICSEKHFCASSIIYLNKLIAKKLASFETTLNDLRPEVQSMVSTLLQETQIRFGSLEDNKLVSEATILDPRFKKFGFNDECKYKQAVEHLYGKVANTDIPNVDHIADQTGEPAESTSCRESGLDRLWKEFDAQVQQEVFPTNSLASAITEVNKYLEQPILPRKDERGVDNDPSNWWHQRKHIFPRVYQIAKTRLCMMATAVPCERIFSDAGQRNNEAREILQTSKIAEIVFLNYNLH